MTVLALRAGGVGLLAAALPALGATHFLIVEGLGGTLAYAEQFRQQVERMVPACRRTAGDDKRVRVLAGRGATAEAIEAAFASLAAELSLDDALAVFLLGHGSHDGRHYKLNIPGPDITDGQLRRWLDAVPAARQLIVSTTSSSGGALKSLAAPRRIVVTATRNGRERTATVFGRFWAEAFEAAAADADKNESISALEAFRYAEARVREHFADNKRLATEHPQLQGEGAGAFLLARLGAAAELADDPATVGLLEQREALEREIDDLRLRKDELPSERYLAELQALLLRIADLQDRIDERGRAAREQP